MERKIITKLEGKTLQATAENIEETISVDNCTQINIGLEALEAGGTQPTLANMVDKLGTVEIKKNGTQVSIDADDIAYFVEKIYGELPVVQGTQTDNYYQFLQLAMPLSPYPYCPEFGYQDATIVHKTAADPGTMDTSKLYVEAVTHNVAPKYSIQMIGTNFTATANSNKDIDISGKFLMGVHAFGTTGLANLTTSDALTIDEMAILYDTVENIRTKSKFLHAETPNTNGDYLLWDLGFAEGKGKPIMPNTQLRIKPKASDAARVYPIIAV